MTTAMKALMNPDSNESRSQSCISPLDDLDDVVSFFFTDLRCLKAPAESISDPERAPASDERKALQQDTGLDRAAEVGHERLQKPADTVQAVSEVASYSPCLTTCLYCSNLVNMRKTRSQLPCHL